MRAACMTAMGRPDPIDGLAVLERPEPSPPPGWEVIEVRAASLNRHDLWSLQGTIPLPFDLPVILGCDAAGITADGREVVAHAVLGYGDDFRLLSDGVDGTFARYVAVPSSNLVPKPAGLSWEEASCLPTAWLTAYSMLFTLGGLQPGERVLVQGASGGVASAAIALAAAAGAEVVATSRSEEALRFAERLGASEALPSLGRLAKRVDLVVETVGSATWDHSLKSVRTGGRIVICGATTGGEASADLQRLIWREISIRGTRMGTLENLRRLCAFVSDAGVRPAIGRVYDGIEAVPEAMRDLARGRQLGKLVVRVT